MSQIENLLAVYRIERQLRGLQSRLRSAERFLNEQETQLSKLGSRRQSLDSQLRQLQASAAERESEMARLDERIATLREQMNVTKTNKEYQALLAEVNTHKLERARVEEETLELMEKVEQVRTEVDSSVAQHSERERVRDLASEDRQKRHEEIRERVAELEAERVQAAKAVSPPILAELERLLAERDEEAMSPIEVLDKRRHEISCTGCMMTLPVEQLNSLLSGQLTNCSNCGCFLYIDDEAASRLGAGSKR
ncbi:MAG: zinc ribbon domain-containing protein [Phycisphaerales bacterium]